jgi:hypothetical protein
MSKACTSRCFWPPYGVVELNVFEWLMRNAVENNPMWARAGKSAYLTINITVIPRYNAVRLTLIRYYAAVAFQLYLGAERFPPAVF